MVDTREKVENPFTLGPSPKKRKYNPSLDSRVRPQGKVQIDTTGTDIVEALIGFAGVAGSAYIKRTEKKVEADKAVQTSRAVKGLIPTDDATNAGYRAHAAVSIKGQALESQARLNGLAKEKTTDGQWEEAIREEYRAFDEFMNNKYETYGNDVELQKLSAVALRETIPQVTAAREGYKIEHEINDRINSATDVLVNAAASNMITGANPEELVNNVDTMLAPLQLTASQKDAVIINAVTVSDDPKLIAFSKVFTGDRKTSLYDRSGKIQAVDRNNISDKISSLSITFSREEKELNKNYHGDGNTQPTMTQEEYDTYVDGRNFETDGKFMSRSKYEKNVALRDKLDADRFRYVDYKKRFIDSDHTDFSDLTKESQQSLFESVIVDHENRIMREVEKKGLSGEEASNFIIDSRRAYINMVGDQGTKGDMFLDSWIADFKNLASMNVSTTMGVVKDEKGKEHDVLSDKAQNTIFLLDSLSPTSKSEYMREIGADNAKTIDSLSHYLERNIPGPMALSKAQAETRYGKPTKFVDSDTAAGKIMSKMGAWWNKNIPDKQKTFMREHMKRTSIDSHYPLDDRNIDMAVASYKKNWIILKDGTRVQGSAQRIANFGTTKDHYKLSPLSIPSAFNAYINISKSDIIDKVAAVGLDIEDVFPVTDLNTGTMYLQVGTWPMFGTRRPISDLVIMSRQNKIIKDKELLKPESGGFLYESNYLKSLRKNRDLKK